MIRYDITPEDLAERIGSRWLKRAKKRTKKFVERGKYEESSSIWSEIKPVFMELQFQKCIFCERRFSGVEYGRIEHDLEHFRPKSSVKAWPRQSDVFAYSYATGDEGPGYHWLAYDIGNYAAACGICNSVLKSNCFPVAGPRGSAVSDIAQLTTDEKPFLCFPIGGVDRSPEELLTFNVTTALPVGKRGHKKRRGEVMIDFFRLNARDDLHTDRALMIAAYGQALKAAERGEGDMSVDEVRTFMLSPGAPHANCLRSFLRLFDADPVFGGEVIDACSAFQMQKHAGLPAEVPKFDN